MNNKPCDGASNAAAINACKLGSTADLYQVVIHVDEAALISGAGDGIHSTGSSQLPIDTVRRLCCDGSIVPIIENAKDEPLSVGRKVRTITTGIRRALWSRDEGCAFPGCDCKRYVPECGYRLDDWQDDYSANVSLGEFGFVHTYTNRVNSKLDNGVMDEPGAYRSGAYDPAVSEPRAINRTVAR